MIELAGFCGNPDWSKFGNWPANHGLNGVNLERRSMGTISRT